MKTYVAQLEFNSKQIQILVSLLNVWSHGVCKQLPYFHNIRADIIKSCTCH